jgi:hypothetical protein
MQIRAPIFNNFSRIVTHWAVARRGRGEDYVEISLDSEYCYNSLHSDLDASDGKANAAASPAIELMTKRFRILKLLPWFRIQLKIQRDPATVATRLRITYAASDKRD